MVAHCEVYRLVVVSCAETAEPIDLTVGLWTRVGRRNPKFSRIHQVAPMCPLGKAHWFAPIWFNHICLPRRRCGLSSNYFDYLLLLLLLDQCSGRPIRIATVVTLATRVRPVGSTVYTFTDCWNFSHESACHQTQMSFRFAAVFYGEWRLCGFTLMKLYISVVRREQLKY